MVHFFAGGLSCCQQNLRPSRASRLHGEPSWVFAMHCAAKPGPRLTPAKRRQIETAENYRATHCGCTLHNACLRSFVLVKGGYKSGKALYRVMLRTAKDDT